MADFAQFWSFGFEDILSLIVAATALIAVFVTKRSKTEATTKSLTHEVSEVVDDSVLGRFQELLDRLTALEIDLAAAKTDLAQALVEIKELRRLEEYLQASLHEKDKQIQSLLTERDQHTKDYVSLKNALGKARGRIKHLEEVCQRAGINGDPKEI